MNSSELREKSRESLTGKWGKAAIITLLFTIITYVIGRVSEISSLVSAILALVTPLVSVGFTISLMKLGRDENIGILDFLVEGFSSIGKIYLVAIFTFIKMLLPLILLIVSIIVIFYGVSSQSVAIMALGFVLFVAATIYSGVRGYLFVLTPYLIYDEKDLTAKEIVEKSQKAMDGNRWRYFCLNLSFIGWILLGVITLGIGLLWVIPYVQVACAKFYEDVIGNTSASPVEPKAETVTTEE